METQRRVNVPMPMILYSPALRLAASNPQTKGTRYRQDRDVLLNPRNIGPRYLLDFGNDGERLTHGTTRSAGRGLANCPSYFATERHQSRKSGMLDSSGLPLRL
jgi:hypothetical protein